MIAALAGDLTAQRWFDGLPFVSVEVVPQVEGPGRRWPELPTAAANEPQLLLVRLPRALVRAGDAVALRRTIDDELTAGLARLAQRFRQGTPRFLR